MKKTININLGGQPFIIDEQAYDVLHHYFEALRQKFTNEEERKEILADIEARVAEVFDQRMGKTRNVVNEEDVVYIISLMGRPEDIAGEPEPAAGQGAFAASAPYAGRIEKKLFRDPDNKKVGGVISGLCQYFGWGDPTWIRIALVAVILVSMFANLGIGFPIAVIYFIMLIVIPMANTSSEKLQMRGQPVTIQNIEKEVRDAMTTAGSSINSMMKDSNPHSRITDALLMITRGLAKIILVFVILLCAVLMLVLATSFFGLSVLSSSSLSELTHLVVSSRHTIMLFNIGLVLAIGIPLVSVMYDSIRYLTNSQAKNPILKRVMWGIWFIGIIMLSITSWNVFKNFAATDTTSQKVQLLTPRGGTLHVQLADTLGHALEIRNSDDEQFSSFVHISGLARTAYGFSFSDLKLEIAVSPDSNFYVERVSFSRGATIADAGRNIQMMRYKFSQTDTTLNLDDKFELPKDGKWRGQKIKIRIYVPEGMRISFADNIDQVETSVKGNDYFDDGFLANKVLDVENGKVKCLGCKEKTIDESAGADEEPDSAATHKEHVNIHVNGSKDSLTDVSVNVNQTGLSVSGKNKMNEQVKIKVNEQGVRVITLDSNGNKIVSKKQ
jgi:phage shock protein PspC (stress-responsive transcriptional regulator)